MTIGVLLDSTARSWETDGPGEFFITASDDLSSVDLGLGDDDTFG